MPASVKQFLAWWMSQNTKDRHLWPGNYTGRASALGRVTWPVGEIFEQITATRDQLGASSGNVHFPINAFRFNRDSLVERLMAGPYAEPALVPASPWLTVGLPKTPVADATMDDGGVRLTIRLPRETPAATPAGSQKAAPRRAAAAKLPPLSSDPRWWLVRARYADGWRSRITDARQSEVHLANDPIGGAPEYITVSTIDRVGLESEPVVVTGTRESVSSRTGGR